MIQRLSFQLPLRLGGAKEKIQLENLQNGLLLPLDSILERLLSRRFLRPLCCARAEREGQCLPQLVFPEGLHACLQSPEAIYTSPTGHSKAFLNVYKSLSSEFPVHGQSQLHQFPVLLISLKKFSVSP